MADDGFGRGEVQWQQQKWAKDLEWDKNKSAEQGARPSGSESCGTVLGFISTIQEISVQEALLTEKLDKTLFTLSKTLCAFKNGLSIGISTSFLIIGHVLMIYLFSFSYISSKFETNPFLGFAIEHLFVALVLFVTIYISYLSKFAVGEYTAKAIKSFFMGKLSSTMGIGFVVYLSFLYIEPFLAKANLNPTMAMAREVFIDKLPVTFYITVFLLVFSAFLPFAIYSLRSVLFKDDHVEKYKNY
ncbi:MAG: hypothetical protein RBS91_08665 [Sulfurimonadaceae bacterium]|jgi:hypothetical protein|nr:hypothetical protein [Sulfurimonadaceae bacterium]